MKDLCIIDKSFSKILPQKCKRAFIVFCFHFVLFELRNLSNLFADCSTMSRIFSCLNKRWRIVFAVHWAYHKSHFFGMLLARYMTENQQRRADYFSHDDVTKWNHFPRYRPFARGIHRSPVNSPHKGQWRGALMRSLICAWINNWINNRAASDLRRHSAHCDVDVMSPDDFFL